MHTLTPTMHTLTDLTGRPGHTFSCTADGPNSLHQLVDIMSHDKSAPQAYYSQSPYNPATTTPVDLNDNSTPNQHAVHQHL